MIFKDRLYKLDLLVLSVLSHHDLTCETIMTTINEKTHQLFNLKDGIIFSHLHYLEKTLLISSYKKDNNIYYHINSAGLVRLDMLKRQYYQTVDAIENLLTYQEEC